MYFIFSDSTVKSDTIDVLFFMQLIWCSLFHNGFHHSLCKRAINYRLLLLHCVGVEQQSGTQTHFIIITLQYIKIPTGLTPFPKLSIICKLWICNWLKSKLRVHLHYGQTRSDTKYICIGIKLSRKIKNISFNSFS